MKALLRSAWNCLFQHLPLSAIGRLAAQELVAPCFHLIADETPEHVRHLYRCPTSAGFSRDLDFLLRYFTPVSLGDLYDHLRHGKKLPPKAAFLSFDDGFREMSELVAPLCKAKGVPATFFLTTAFLDNRELGFRHKASLLIEQCGRLGSGNSQQLLDTVLRRWPAVKVRDRATPGELFLSVRYADAAFLDECAAVLGLDFSSYLRTARPYLTWDQAGQLMRDGFTIGGHSVDHPRYGELPLDEQLSQTRRCLGELQSRLSLPLKTFAFPFVSDGVTERFYEVILQEGCADLFFCIGQMPGSTAIPAIQRFGVEGSSGAALSSILRDYVSARSKSRLANRIFAKGGSV